MDRTNLIPRTEIVSKSEQDALQLMSLLSRQNYVCMLSREEDLFIINYIWSPTADRNDVVFMDRESYEDIIFGEAE